MHTKEARFDYCIVVDLDYTLVNTDTTAKLIEVMCPRRYRFLSVIFTLLKPLMWLINTMLDRDLYKFILLHTCLKKCHDPILEDVAEIVYREMESTRLNHNLLRILKEFGGVKILLTASIDSIAKKFSRLGFDLVISSVIECHEGDLYSFLDLYKRKHIVLKHVLKYCGKVVVIEDSPELQYKMLERVKVIQATYHERR